VLGSGNEYSDEDGLFLETITSGYKEFASGSGRANDHYPLWNMNESFSEQRFRLTNHMFGGWVPAPGFDGWLFPGEPRRWR
jgi:hypothetical protein